LSVIRYSKIENVESLGITPNPEFEVTMSFFHVISAIGITAIVAVLVYIGRKLQVLDDVKVTTNLIKQNMKVICDFLIRSNSDFDSTELQSFSPLSLTQAGEDFVKNSHFDVIFNEHKNDFFECINSESPKMKYDVESSAIKAIFILADKDYMGFLKEFFYNNPARSLENTAPTLGVYMRDKYLAEHPEITK
jgi:hypothetical protein